MTAGDISTVATIVATDPSALAALAAVRSLDLPDGWIAAGFVRNRVWDHLSGLEARPPLGDVDVIYLDRADPEGRREAEHEQRLRSLLPATDWQVRNQARMHLRNREPPYHDCNDAIAHFLETPTAVAIRMNVDGRLELLAPHGLDDLLALACRPTPSGIAKPDEYRQRVLGKRWQELWPRLRIHGL